MQTRIGAHLSSAGGYQNAFRKLTEIGGTCLQIFSSSPRTWKTATLSEDEIATLISLKKKFNVEPIYFHASYLVNLADSERIGKLSVHALIEELLLAKRLGVRGIIVHLGSFKSDTGEEQEKKYNVLIQNIQHVLDKTPPETFFIIENAGNRKIGADIREIGKIIRDLANTRVKVCLDTCHLYATGYDLSTQEKFNDFFTQFEQYIDFEKLECFQVNDSKDILGSYRDRHENIGEGTVGIHTFRLLLTDAKTKNLPYILETPGFDHKGPDKKNMDILKSFIDVREKIE